MSTLTDNNTAVLDKPVSELDLANNHLDAAHLDFHAPSVEEHGVRLETTGTNAVVSRATTDGADVASKLARDAAERELTKARTKRMVPDFVRFGLKTPKFMIGFSIIMLLAIWAIIGPYLAPFGPTERVPGATMLPPNATHWFGTTMQGQDIFSQFSHGLRSSFIVGFIGATISTLLGIAIGLFAGFRGGLVDDVLNALTNIMLVIPGFVVLVLINAYMSIANLVTQALFIGFFSWPWVARAVRSNTLSLRAREFVDLARISGSSTWSIIRREVVPNMASYLFMCFVLLFGGAILAAAGLDFLGIGPQHRTFMSLGLMMNQAMQWSALALQLWWWFLVPGAAITAIVGSLHVLNAGLDEGFNPKLREK